MRTLLLSSVVMALSALPAHAAPTGAPADASYGCTVEARVNRSTLEELPVEPARLIFAAGELELRDGLLAKREVVNDGDREALVTHTIDPSSNRYAATTLLTDHSIGEQHLIEASGTCAPLGGE
jgi:hypothetical protein